MMGTVQSTDWVTTGTSPVQVANVLIKVSTTGARINGTSIVKLKIIGNPNTAISLILNKAEGNAT